MKKIELFLYNKITSFIIAFVFLLSLCYTEGILVLDWIVNISCILFSIIIISFYLLKREISKFSLCLIIYCMILFVSTILSETASLYKFFATHFRIVSLTFYLDLGFKYYYKNIINSFYWSFFILTIINFLTIVLYPNGLYFYRQHTNNWFFEYDNRHILMYLPAIMFMFFRTTLYNTKFKIYDFILFGIITYCIFYCFSATSIMGYSVLLVYLLLRKYIDKFKIFNSITYAISYVTVFFGIVIFRLQRFFSVLIVDILGKDLTFSKRTVVWDRTIAFIKQRFIFGYGVEHIEVITQKLNGWAYTTAHNTILDVLYKGGIIALIAFIAILILPIYKLYKYRNNKLTKLMSIIFLSFFVMMNFEARNTEVGLYIFLTACYNINNIIKNIEENKKFS